MYIVKTNKKKILDKLKSVDPDTLLKNIQRFSKDENEIKKICSNYKKKRSDSIKTNINNTNANSDENNKEYNTTTISVNNDVAAFKNQLTASNKNNILINCLNTNETPKNVKPLSSRRNIYNPSNSSNHLNMNKNYILNQDNKIILKDKKQKIFAMEKDKINNEKNINKQSIDITNTDKNLINYKENKKYDFNTPISNKEKILINNKRQKHQNEVTISTDNINFYRSKTINKNFTKETKICTTNNNSKAINQMNIYNISDEDEFDENNIFFDTLNNNNFDRIMNLRSEGKSRAFQSKIPINLKSEKNDKNSKLSLFTNTLTQPSNHNKPIYINSYLIKTEITESNPKRIGSSNNKKDYKIIFINKPNKDLKNHIYHNNIYTSQNEKLDKSKVNFFDEKFLIKKTRNNHTCKTTLLKFNSTIKSLENKDKSHENNQVLKGNKIENSDTKRRSSNFDILSKDKNILLINKKNIEKQTKNNFFKISNNIQTIIKKDAIINNKQYISKKRIEEILNNENSCKNQLPQFLMTNQDFYFNKF